MLLTDWDRLVMALSSIRGMQSMGRFTTILAGALMTATLTGCVERLRLDGPDLLALTLDLPWGSGEGIVALIATGELPRVPVVLLADYPCSLRVNPGGWSPVRWLLPWPAPPRLLGKAVRQVLAGNPLGRPSPEIDAPTHDWAAQPLHLA